MVSTLEYFSIFATFVVAIQNLKNHTEIDTLCPRMSLPLFFLLLTLSLHPPLSSVVDLLGFVFGLQNLEINCS